jgi:predicted ribonuclease toxin of YeeF-YezG toxin-antitoxin module
MPVEWPVIFQGISAASAVVQAVKAALEARKLSREEVKAIASKAEAEAKVLGKPLPSIDEEMREVIEKKLKGAKKKWLDAIDGSDEQNEWAKGTDRYRSDICAILRNIKQVNGGVLPDDWYTHWTANQCA